MTNTTSRLSALTSRLSMDGKVVLVTGASSGLGAHFSRLLAAAGARVQSGEIGRIGGGDKRQRRARFRASNGRH
jgi:NADPH:quinone reductase-like Zn-dependent oxidoreductase